LTIASLETTLTTTSTPTSAGLAFRGKPDYAQILAQGGVDVVTIANNHSDDFGRAGLEQTLEALGRAGVGAFGNGRVDRRTVRGVEVVNLGYTGGRPGAREL